MVMIVVLLNVLAYMTVPAVGFATTAATVLVVFAQPRRTALEKLLIALVLTMPLYAMPLVDGLQHIVSWTTVLLVITTFYVGAHMRRLSPLTFVLLIPIVLLTFLTHLSFKSTDGSSWYYITQILLFVIPAVVVYEARDWIGMTLDRESVDRLFGALVATLMACGLGVFVQWIALNEFGTAIGSVTPFAARVSLDLTINAYSVLSSILAVGIVLAPTLFRRGQWVRGVLLVAISAGAILLNTSRTGLVVGAVVLLVALAFPPDGTKRILRRLALIPAGFFVWFLFQAFSDSSRAAALGNILADNGRFVTIEGAMATSFSDPITLLAGIGYNNPSYDQTSPHNFLVESLLRSGLIVTIATVMLVVGLLWFLRRSEWQYPIWVLIGSAMFFAGFYEVKAAVVIAMLMITFRTVEEAATLPRPTPPFQLAHNQMRYKASPMREDEARRSLPVRRINLSWHDDIVSSQKESASSRGWFKGDGR